MKNGFKLIFFLMISISLFFTSLLGQHPSDNSKSVVPSPTKVASVLNIDTEFPRLPLCFIPNHGQVHRDVLFYSRSKKYSLWITKKELIFDSTKNTEVRGQKSEGRKFITQNSKLKTSIQRDVSTLAFIGASDHLKIIPLDMTVYSVNYFMGHDKTNWKQDIPTYTGILFKNLYPNIDLKVYGVEKLIEYDWIVKAGGNPEDIRISFRGVRRTKIDNEGNLILTSKFGKIIHKKPVSYQQVNAGADHHVCPSKTKNEGKIQVKVDFKKLSKNRYSFDVGNYDKSKELIIDPLIVPYSSFLGGSQRDEINDITVDTNGNIYVTGSTSSTDFPVMTPLQTSYAGLTTSSNAFVTKFSPSGQSLVYSTYLGGVYDDEVYGIEVDGNENVYLVGTTLSHDFPLHHPFQDTFGGGLSDAFVTKISAQGNSLIYSTFLGGEIAHGTFSTFSDFGSEITVDSLGHAYVCGYTYAPDFPLKNPFQSTLKGVINGFITKFSPSGDSLVYSTYLGGDSLDFFTSIVVDNSGCAYVTGYTGSFNFPIHNAFQSSHADGYYDVFVSKLSEQGDSLVYSTFIGGTGADTAGKMTIDLEGNVYVTGSTESTDFPIQNAYQNSISGSYDAFITKLSSSGNSLVYSTYLGGVGKDEGTGIGVDDNQCVYITGATQSQDFPLLHAFQNTHAGGDSDAFITKLSSSGDNLIYSTYFGGSDADTPSGITLHHDGSLYMAGDTLSSNLFMSNAYQSTYGGNKDSFLTRFYYYPTTTGAPEIYTNRSQLVFSATTTGTVSAGQTFSVTNTGTGTLHWTASSGSSWLKISPVLGTNSGTISVIIDTTGLAEGNYNGLVTISDQSAINSPQTVSIMLTVYSQGQTKAPFGTFETPLEHSTVMGSIPVTGWVLDDVGVDSVKIYRKNAGNLAYIGDAVFVEGARPDVEQAFPNYPDNYKAGWGYMMLTNFLPDGGNGTFVLHAIAKDLEGNSTTLGTKTIYGDNAHAVKPFGAIDTPSQGGLANGSEFLNWGWVLTPLPNSIPFDGSTINVWVDGINLGQPVYNNFRPDIARLFPNYANSNGAVGYFYLDTMAFENGVHTIQWTATDNAGNTNGIGSRYFNIENNEANNQQSKVTSHEFLRSRTTSDIAINSQAPTLWIKKGFTANDKPIKINSDNKGFYRLTIKELEPVEINFDSYPYILVANNQINHPQNSKSIGVYYLRNGTLGPLPIGATFETNNKIFRWHPGPGFLGEYRFLLVTKKHGNFISKNMLVIKIVPKFSKIKTVKNSF